MRRAGFDPAGGSYVDFRAARGFPLGGIGAGGVCLATDGGFGELRANNNWMRPLRDLRGSLLALWTRPGGVLLLRRSAGDAPEYTNARAVAGTTFVGMLPECRLTYDDPTLPVDVVVDGFTPHVPHDERHSTMPAALLRVTLTNPGATAVAAAVCLSFENPLGRGGSGFLGVELAADGAMTGVHRPVVYDAVAGAWQEAVTVGPRRGIRFRTDQSWDPRSHRRGVVGEYLLLVEEDDGVEITICDAWDASASRASLLDDLAADGRLVSRDTGRRGADGGFRPAAAIAARTMLAAGDSRTVTLALAWWLPDHVAEPSLPAHRGAGPHDGVRVGHVYARHFASIDAVATTLLDERAALRRASTEVGALLDDSTLPRWLVRVLRNAIDSTLANTVVPEDGTLYTLEGVDWVWPMGALTGTNDQRLAAHVYMATFFPELDRRELDAFARLADPRGAIPHGNGNADLALGSTDVPYGWPLYIKDFLPAKEWTDLTLSFVLQAGRHWRQSGDAALLARWWPVCVRGMEYLQTLAPHGVPEGGTTYDVWDFPGCFAYTATLHLAALRTMIAMAAHAEPSRVADYERRRAACAARLDALWDARGYVHAGETTDTLFTATLAGDWIARLAGLEPVVDAARAASHLRHQHRVLVRAARDAAGGAPAIPWSEATFDGEQVPHRFGAGLPPGEAFTYVWQVVSYQACEQIYVGQVAEAMETLQAIYDRLWSDGNAWSGGLRGNGESIYMTHPVAWAVPPALTGAALDVPGRTLHLGPRPDGTHGRLRCPIFFPGLWATCEHDAASGDTMVEVVRTFGAPATVDRVVHRRADGSSVVHALAPTPLVAGTRLALRLA